MHLPRLDNNGRASFAVLALAILLLANFSVVYLFRVQQEGIELAMQANEIRVMDELSSAANREVEVAAHYIAMRAILNPGDEVIMADPCDTELDSRPSQ